MAIREKIGMTVLTCGTVLTLCAGCASGHSTGKASPVPQDSVVTGYGSESKATAGAVTSIKTENLPGQPPESIEQWLATRVPGLEVLRMNNGDYTLKIHGASSFYMNTEPLIVVDGTPLPPGGLRGALGFLSPRDIARIDVLKEGDTTLYGTRGGNGVIVITTKRGGDKTPIRP